MTLNDLIEQLEQLRDSIADELGIDADTAGEQTGVTAVTQPNYPLLGDLHNIIAARFVDRNDEDGNNADEPFTVYLGIDDGRDYGNEWMFEGDGDTITCCKDCEQPEYECDCDEDDDQ